MNPWGGLRNLPKEMWLLALSVFINRSGMMVLPFLVLYLTRTLGYGTKEAGLALTFYGLAALVTAPFAGKLSDRVRPLRVMKYSLLFSGATILWTSTFVAGCFSAIMLWNLQTRRVDDP